MATLSLIEPRKSKRTGDIPFTIEGTGFLTSDLSDDFSSGTFGLDISSGGGSLTQSGDIALEVDSTPNSIAGVDTDHTFERSFDVSFLHSYSVSSLPAVDGAKVIALRAYDDLDDTTYYDVSLNYKDEVGYYMESKASVSGSVVHSKTFAIDPALVEGLKIIRSEERITGYFKMSGEFVEVGNYLGFADFSSRIRSYIQNSTLAVSGPFSVSLNEYKVDYAISLVNVPAIFKTASDTEITGVTRESITGTGDVVVGFPDGSFAEIANGFEYTIKQGRNIDTKNFDMIISVFEFYINPSRNELFTSAGSFSWDENYWIDPDKQNKNLFIPSLWDPTTANVPAEFLQSGHGDGDNIELVDIKKYRSESNEKWFARLNHGTYFVRNVPYYLYSDESVTIQLGTSTTADGRSKQPLKYKPKPGVPITVGTFTTDIESGLIVNRTRFDKRGRFTGIVQNGVELDSSIVSNIDKAKNEFIVNYNPNNSVTNWRIPVSGSDSGLFSFTLPKIPLSDYPVVFTRTDIFSNQKFAGSFYGDPNTIYGQSFYGEPLDSVGDYSVNYVTGEVQVILDQAYIDMGYVTFTFDYPATIEFNDTYLIDRGGDITNPTPSDISSLDVVGESDGSGGQIFRLTEFPVLDFSDSQFLDTNNFNLFLYDESDNSYETDWIRVRDIRNYGPNDKVYQLNPDQGTIFFGNNISGQVPQKYKKVVAGYKTSLRIEYEPFSSVNYWTGKETDLNLSRNSLNSGFLYLSRKELIPDNISIQFSTDKINALEFAELTAVVRDRDGDPVPGADLQFQIVNGDGNLEEESIVTDSNGEAKTTFIPSGEILDMGIYVNLFEPGVDSNTLGSPLTNLYFDSGALQNNVIIAEESINNLPNEVYIFKIYDDSDPFNRYNNQTLSGGTYQVLYEFNSTSGQNEVIKPVAINGNVLIFDQSLPQPFNPAEPNYEPNLRGFAIIGNKEVQAKASVDAGLVTIDSDIANLYVEYSPIQKGEWTLPIPPTDFNSSEIDRATYITINP